MNFGTMYMKREELEEYFNTSISPGLFNYMKNLNWNVKRLQNLAEQGNAEAKEALEHKAISVQDTWEYAISDWQEAFC